MMHLIKRMTALDISSYIYGVARKNRTVPRILKVTDTDHQKRPYKLPQHHTPQRNIENQRERRPYMPHMQHTHEW